MASTEQPSSPVSGSSVSGLARGAASLPSFPPLTHGPVGHSGWAAFFAGHVRVSVLLFWIAFTALIVVPFGAPGSALAFLSAHWAWLVVVIVAVLLCGMICLAFCAAVPADEHDY
jgi:hypothetical protein